MPYSWVEKHIRRMQWIWSSGCSMHVLHRWLEHELWTPHMPIPRVHTHYQQAAPAHAHVGVDTGRAIAPRTRQLPARGSSTTQSLYINVGRFWDRLYVSEEVRACCYQVKFCGHWHNPTAVQTHCSKRSFLTSNSSQQSNWESYYSIVPDWQLKCSQFIFRCTVSVPVTIFASKKISLALVPNNQADDLKQGDCLGFFGG